MQNVSALTELPAAPACIGNCEGLLETVVQHLEGPTLPTSLHYWIMVSTYRKSHTHTCTQSQERKLILSEVTILIMMLHV